MKPRPGMIACLVVPYKGYTAIRLKAEIEFYLWLVEILDTGFQLLVYEDQFEID